MNQADGRPGLSIVTTMYRSEPHLREFIERADRAAKSAGVERYEIVCVDDGSPDGSLALARAMRADFPALRVVALSRNFGHHQAAIAGLACSRGELVFLIDCDLEVDPATLSAFLSRRAETGADVVFGYQVVRKGDFAARVGGRLFWRLFNLLSDTQVPENVLTERVMTRGYVDALLALGDRNVFLAGMMYWAGFRQIGMPVEKRARTGTPSYDFRRRFSLLGKAITSFSTAPLRATLWIGVTAMAVAFANAAYIVARKLLMPESTLLGFASLVALITAVFGALMIALGVIGIYIARIFVQTQNRPLYIIRDVD